MSTPSDIDQNIRTLGLFDRLSGMKLWKLNINNLSVSQDIIEIKMKDAPNFSLHAQQCLGYLMKDENLNFDQNNETETDQNKIK